MSTRSSDSHTAMAPKFKKTTSHTRNAAVSCAVAAVLLSRPGATRADVSLVSFDTADLPLRFVGAAEHYLKVNDACGASGRH